MWMFFAAFFIIIFVLLDYYIKHTDKYLATANLRKPKSYPIIGCMEALSIRHKHPEENLFKFSRKCARKFSKEKCYAVMAFGFHCYETFKLSDLEIVLSHPKHTTKSTTYDFLHPFLGQGLLTSKGTKWSQRRRILTPTFHFTILQKFLNTFKDESDKMIRHLKESHIKSKGVIALQDVVPRFTLNTICETAMGATIDNLQRPDEYRQRIQKVGYGIVQRMISPWHFNDTIYRISGAKAKFEKVCALTHEFTKSVIKKRRQLYNVLNVNNSMQARASITDNIYLTKQRYAMLDTLLTAEVDGLIDEAGICEEVDTFMFEGYDTTSVGLMFTLFMIAHHFQIQQDIYEEIANFRSRKAGQPLESADYNEFKLLDRVIKESLRMYPPVPFIGRQTTEELYLSDTLTLPPQMDVFIHIYDMHHDPDLYKDPEKFNPDRFLPENMANSNAYAYIPFSAGPRNCIGQKFAMLEMKTVLVEIVSNFKLEAITKVEDIVFVSDLVLRARDPIEVRLLLR